VLITIEYLLIDDTVNSQDLVQEKVEEASKDATNYTKDIFHCDRIQSVPSIPQQQQQL
jgi:trehalose-6-phosphate synthase